MIQIASCRATPHSHTLGRTAPPWALLAAFLAAFAAPGCASGVQALRPPPVAIDPRSALQSHQLFLRGNIHSIQSHDQGAAQSLQAYSLNAQGRLAALTAMTAVVQADGTFTLQAALPSAAPGELLLRADGPQGFAMALLDGEALQSLARLQVRLDQRSTLAALIYLSARGAQQWPLCRPAGAVQPQVSVALAQAAALHSRSYTADIRLLGEASAAAAFCTATVPPSACTPAAKDRVATAASAPAAPLPGNLNDAAASAAAAQARAEAYLTYGRLVRDVTGQQALVDVEVLRAQTVTQLLQNALAAFAGEHGAVQSTGKAFSSDSRAEQALQASGQALLRRLSQAAQAGSTPSGVKSLLHRAWLDYQAQAAGLLRPLCKKVGVDCAAQSLRDAQAAQDLGLALGQLDASASPQQVAQSTADALHTFFGVTAALQPAGFAPPSAWLNVALSNLAVACR
jgi:hypothetical protein